MFVKAIKSGADDVQLLTDFPSTFMIHERKLPKLRMLCGVENKPFIPERAKPLTVHLYYGPPGTGKTEYAVENGKAEGFRPLRLPIGKDFWLTEDLSLARYIILEDFKCNIGLSDLLNLLDKYPVQAPIKGSFVWWLPERVVITTNRSPWMWYDYSSRDFEREALFRRIHKCFIFGKNEELVPKPVEVDINVKSNFDIVVARSVTEAIMPISDLFNYETKKERRWEDRDPSVQSLFCRHCNVLVADCHC